MSTFVATPGVLPRFGLNTLYQAEDGTTYDCVIDAVGHHSPDGKRYNVNARVVGVQGWPQAARLQYIWQYDVEPGVVLYVPCGPPWV